MKVFSATIHKDTGTAQAYKGLNFTAMHTPARIGQDNKHKKLELLFRLNVLSVS
jgi:hypothetical protein